MTNEPAKVKSAILCGHANENPAQCQCPPDCYCKKHTCKNRTNEPASLPTIVAEVEFRREQYGWTMTEMAYELGIAPPHYSEFVHGKRNLPLIAIRNAYRIGFPAKVLLQMEKS